MISLDPSQNFGELFRSVQAGKYAIIKTSTDLSAAVLEFNSGVSVGKDKSSLSLVDKDLNTVDVCTAFGHFVKFAVTLNEPCVSSSLDVSTGQLESGKSYLTTVTAALWYIDHHQSTLTDRGCEIPELFKPFGGYNT